MEPGCSNLLSFPEFCHCQQSESGSLHVHLGCYDHSSLWDYATQLLEFISLQGASQVAEG